MQSVDLIMHSLTHLNIGGLIAIVLWIMWVISLTANTSWPVAFAGQHSMSAPACMVRACYTPRRGSPVPLQSRNKS